MQHLRNSGQRLTWLRERAGFRSARNAAMAHGWNETSYRAHEHDDGKSGPGKRKIGPESAKQYARAFQGDWLWILYGDVAPGPARPDQTLLVCGAAGEDGAISFFEPTADNPLPSTEMPPGLSPQAAAVVVRGNALAPIYNDGDMLYYDAPLTGRELAKATGCRCVVKVNGGAVLIRKPVARHKPNRWTLLTLTGEVEPGQRLEWAAPIAWHRLAGR